MKVDVNNYNESAIRNIAAAKAEQDSHYNRRNKIIQGAILATPVIEGVAAMVNSPKLSINNTAILNSERFGQNIVNHVNGNLPYIKGAAARSLNGLKGFGNLASYLVAGLLVSGASRKVAEKSEKYKEFRENNSMINWLGVAAGAIALVVGAKKGAGAIMDRMKPETLEKIFNNMAKHGDKFNDNRIVKAISNGYNKLAGKFSEKAQNRIKNILAYATTGVILSSVAGSIANNANFENKFRNNYNELKEQQLAAAAADVDNAS